VGGVSQMTMPWGEASRLCNRCNAYITSGPCEKCGCPEYRIEQRVPYRPPRTRRAMMAELDGAKAEGGA
jgi:hypothetical protein